MPDEPSSPDELDSPPPGLSRLKKSFTSIGLLYCSARNWSNFLPLRGSSSKRRRRSSSATASTSQVIAVTPGCIALSVSDLGCDTLAMAPSDARPVRAQSTHMDTSRMIRSTPYSLVSNEKRSQRLSRSTSPWLEMSVIPRHSTSGSERGDA